MNIKYFTVGSLRYCAAVALSLALIACGDGSGVSTDPQPNPQTNPPLPTPVAQLPVCPTPSASLTPISAIQGDGLRSPLAGTGVITQGVVTADMRGTASLGGFFMQQLEGAVTPNASQGIFVFAPASSAAGTSTLTVGSYIQIAASVAEFGAGTSTTAINVATQLDNASSVVVCGTTSVPVAVTVSLPVSTNTALERYEGMLVKFADTLSVTDSFRQARFGELILSASGRQFHPNNGNVTVTTAQNQLGRIILDDASSVSNVPRLPFMSAGDTSGTRRIGDTVTGLQGILSYGFNAYRIQPVGTPNFVATNTRSATAPAINGTLKVASFNVLNYFTTFGSSSDRGASSAAEFERQKAKIVEAIVGLDADVLGLIEIQNNGDTAVSDLVAAVNARLGANTYASIGTGTIGGDAIKVDIIYKPARVIKLGNPQLPTGDDLLPFSATPPGTNRPPLAQRFAAVSNNGSFWFIVNHFKSKGSCPTAAGDPNLDNGQGCWNDLRSKQATALNSFVDKLRTSSGEQDVLMMGDFNNYLLEDPSVIMQGAGHESLLKRMPVANRYTYVFGGETGALDHAYASSSMSSSNQVTDINVWHINSDEPIAIDYNFETPDIRPPTNKLDDRYAPTAFRSSDHDPIMVGLTLTPDVVTCQPVLVATVPSSVTQGLPLAITNISVTAIPACPAPQTLTLLAGDGSAAQNLPLTTTQTSVIYASTGSFTLTLVAQDSAGGLSTLTRSVNVVATPTVPPVTTGTPTLIFSEYVEGSFGSNKAIEIYNPTNTASNPDEYVIKLYVNGATTASNSNTYTITSAIAPGGILVIVNSASAPTLTAQITGPFVTLTSSIVNFNGDDALVLERNGVVIDRIGQIGVDPGAAWTGNTGGTTVSTENRTIRRQAAISSGDTGVGVFDPSLQWVDAGANVFSGLGSR
jgi:uncharacterized protein